MPPRLVVHHQQHTEPTLCRSIGDFLLFASHFPFVLCTQRKEGKKKERKRKKRSSHAVFHVARKVNRESSKPVPDAGSWDGN